jgi:DNA repair photolyase
MDGTLSASTPSSRILEFLAPCNLWSVTPYTNCGFGCIYCGAWAQGRSRPSAPPSEFIEHLRAEMRCVAADDGLTVGALADAYPPLEAEVGITRQTIAELIAQRRRFDIVTKGDLVLRDLDLLAQYADVCVHVSLCSLDDDVLGRLDPGAPSATRRLEVIERVRQAGVRVQLSAAPWIPGITDARALLAHTHESVIVQFAPLNVGKLAPGLRILGRRFTQDEVDRLYVMARQRTLTSSRAKWLAPIGAGAHEMFGYI